MDEDIWVQLIDLQEQIARLGALDRTILAAYVLGYTQEEIAKEFGIDRTTVSKRLKRIKQFFNK